MTTVLLWGDCWWLPHQPAPVLFGTLEDAADKLAAAWPEKPKILRLVFHPDDFATVAVTCPNGNRTTLALALGNEYHPALTDPSHAWAYEPILGSGDGFGTLLHRETTPGLFALVERLEELGFTVPSACPLPTWLNALPSDLSDSGAVTILALHANRFCLYRHSADGVRTVHHGQGSDVAEVVARHFDEWFANAPDEHLTVVTTDDALVGLLNDRAPLVNQHTSDRWLMAEALSRPTILPTRHPAQLLTPAARISAARTVTFATGVCVVVTLAALANAAHDHTSARTDHAARETHRGRLRSEVAHLRENRAEITALQAELAAAARRPPVASLLERLSATVPSEIVLTAFRATPELFVIDGWLAPNAPAGVGEAWATRLNAAESPWKFAATLVPNADGAFRLRGTFR